MIGSHRWRLAIHRDAPSPQTVAVSRLFAFESYLLFSIIAGADREQLLLVYALRGRIHVQTVRDVWAMLDETFALRSAA
jgi:hypothetical protein